MISKKLLKLTILTCLAIGALSCNQKKSIELAYIAPLSGTNSLLGLEGRDGFALSLEAHFKEQFDVKVSYFDDKGDAKKSLELVKTIINQGFKYLIFNSTSGASLDSINYAVSQGVFCFSSTVSSGDLTGKKDYFFRTANSNIAFGKTIAEMIISHSPVGDPGKIVSIGDTSNANYVSSINKSAGDRFVANNSATFITQNFDGNNSFNAGDLAKNILAEKPDWVILVANPLNSANIMQNLQKLGSKARVFLSPFGANVEYIKQAGVSSEGTYVLSTSLFEKNQIYLDFAETYKNKTGKEASYFAQYGYDTAWVLYQIFSQLNDYSPESIAKYLESGKNFNGLNKPIRIDEFGDAQANFYLYQVKNGAFERSDNQ